MEEQFIRLPSVDEYLDASNREQTRALHTLAERLALYGFDGSHLFPGYSLGMLSIDTPERRERDREIIDAWDKTQGRDRIAEIEGARERLLATLEAP